MKDQELPPQGQMLQMIMGTWIAQGVGTVARLSLADHLANGPQSAKELADKSGANADAVHRLMRALASVGVFAMDGERFSLTPLGQTLRAGVPGSMKNFAIAETDTAHWLTWARFADAIRAGRGMAKEALGADPWDYYAKHPQDGEHFSRAMADASSMAIDPVLATYDLSFAGKIVDVGGAHGALLAAMLKKKPDATGILFDLPHVAATAKGAIEAAGLSQRVEIISGDFFKQVPSGGDLYLLKHILHDWDDSHCVSLLKSLRAAMKPTAKLLVVELMLPSDATPSPAHWMDLNMLVMVNGRERSTDQYRKLLAEAGLKLERFIPTQGLMGLIEATLA